MRIVGSKDQSCRQCLIGYDRIVRATREVTTEYWFRVDIDDAERDWDTWYLCDEHQPDANHKILQDKRIEEAGNEVINP